MTGSWQEKLRSRRLAGLLALALGGGLLRLWGVDFGLPAESVPPENQILGVVLGNLLHPIMTQGDLSLNPGSSEYPGLYYFILSLVYGLLYTLGPSLGAFSDWQGFLHAWENDPTLWHLILRCMAVACGTAMIPLAYLLGKRVADRRVGWVLAALVAGSYLLVRTAHFGLPHMLAAMMLMLALLMLRRFHQKRTPESMTEAAVVCGLVMGLDYLAIALLPVLWVLLLMPHWSENHIDWRGFARAAGRPTALMLGVFFLTSPWLLLDGGQGLVSWWLQLYGQQTGWTGWRFYPLYGLFFGLGGWALAFAGLGGIQAYCTPDRSARWWHASVLGGFLSLVVLLGMQTRPQSVQAVLLAPIVLFYAALGVVYAAGLVQRVLGLARAGVALGLVTLIALYQPIFASLRLDRLLARPDTREVVQQIIRQRVAPGSAIATGPRIGRLNLPVAYGQLLDETGLPSQRGEVQLRPLDPRTQLASSFAHPQMFRDLGVRYVVLYEGFPPYSNSPSEWAALRGGASPVFEVLPQKVGVFDWQLDLDEPRFEPFLPVYVPFTGLQHFQQPGPAITVFDVAPQSGKTR